MQEAYYHHILLPISRNYIRPNPKTQLIKLPTYPYSARNPSQNILQNRKPMQRSRKRHRNGIIRDPVLSVPSRTRPENDIDNPRHGLVQRVF